MYLVTFPVVLDVTSHLSSHHFMCLVGRSEMKGASRRMTCYRQVSLPFQCLVLSKSWLDQAVEEEG